MIGRLLRLFHARPDSLAFGSKEITDALRVAAKLAESEAARTEYTAAADALDRAVSHVQQSDKGTRDEVMYALGQTTFSLRDQLRELIEVSKDTHLLVQGVHSSQQEQGAAVLALRAEFHEGMQAIGERVSDIETTVKQHSDKIAGFERTRDQSIDERKELRADLEASKQDRRAIREEVAALKEQEQQHYDEIEAQMKGLAQTVQQALARLTEYDDRFTPEQRAQMTEAMIALTEAWPQLRALIDAPPASDG